MSDRPRILGVPFDTVALGEAAARSRAALTGDRLFHVVTAGPEFVMASRSQPEFAETLKRADLSLPDGMGILVAAKILRVSGLRRIPGMAYLERLLSICAKDKASVFFYGAMPGVAQAAAAELVRRYPGLEVAGVESGLRGWLLVPDSCTAWKIRRSGARVLFVALGAPAQELWIDRHRARLGNVRLAVGVGGAFDFWSGRIRRAPLFFQKLGFEWAWRLLREPRKRWRRIVTATWMFLREVWREKRRLHV